MSLTLKELSLLNTWIAAKIRFEIASTHTNRSQGAIERSAREMQNAWDELGDLVAGNDHKEAGAAKKNDES